MKNRRPIYIFGTAAILILAFFVIFSNSSRKYTWGENYEEEDKDPYGTYVIHELLKDYFPGERLEDLSNSLRGELPISTDRPSNYVFVGEGIFLDTADVDRLLTFVEGGNKAFIASKSIPYDLMYYLYPTACNEIYWEDYYSLEDTAVQLNLVHADLQHSESFEYRYIYQHESMEYYWHFIDTTFFCPEDFSPIALGQINGRQSNFAQFNYGKGAFYLHTTPIAFTNIQLMDKVGIDYTSRVFSHLNEGTIYWDAFSRVDEEVSRKRNNSNMNSGGSRLSTKSPLKYILAQPPLAWAWYLLLATALLYLIFRAKRKQRIIPILESNANTSMEFISTIGSLYFLRNDHKKLSLQKMRLFLAYIRQRYHLPTGQLDEVFVKKLSSHSEVPESLINKILLYYNNIKSSTFVSEQTLIDFHIEMDKFYKNCK